MKKRNKLFILSLLGIFFASCEPDDKTVDQYQPKGNYDSGVFVLNEGKFDGDKGKVSFISFDLSSTQNNIYSVANSGELMGKTAQSIAFNGDLAYLIVSGSDKIVVVNRFTMVKVTTIMGLNKPQYMAFANGKGFVTNWGVETNPDDDFVAVINLSANTIEKRIAVSEGPQQIIESSGKLFISHKGGYNYGNTISVIPAISEAVTNSINVGDVPNTMAIKDGSLWVLCEGNPNFVEAPLTETAGKLHKINIATTAIESTYNFPNATDHPSNLVIYNSNVYYTKNSGIYKMGLTPVTPATSISLPIAPVFTSLAVALYGFSIKNNKIYVADAKDYDSKGEVFIYSLGELADSQAIGTLLRRTQVEEIPNGFYFNQ
jgi:hypothetical protein